MDGNWQAGVPGQPGQYGSAQYPQAQQYAQQVRDLSVSSQIDHLMQQ